MFRLLARLALHIFFRQIEVDGRSNVPARGPVLFVPNHTNALVDPLLLVVALRRRITITAKNVLARNPLLGLLMSGLGVVTFHRREDVGKGAKLRQNVRALERCREILADGGALCIFPEGISHSDPKMRPFRTGPARIALDYVREDGNRDRLLLVPVGLLYTEKDRFRSGVWLRFGTPLAVAPWLEQQPEADTRVLTEEIRHRVEALTLNYETQQESSLLSWAAEIVATQGAMPRPLGQDERSVAEWFGLLGRLQAGYQVLRESRCEEVETLLNRIDRYRKELERRGIDPAEVYLPMHVGRALFFVVRELELVVIGSPLALFGIINHLIPYELVKWIARALSTDKDHWASNTIYPAFLIFPLFYVLQLGAAWLLLPWFWAALYTVALPYTGYYALLYRDRIGSTWRRARTFFHFLRDPAERVELAREGREIIAAIRTLGEFLPPASDDLAAWTFARSAADFEEQFRADCATLGNALAAVDRQEEELEQLRQEIAAQQRGYFTPDEDDRVRRLLLAYRNNRLVLYDIIGRCLDWEEKATSHDQVRVFMLGYAAALILFSKSLRLIQLYEHQPLVRKKLNEADAKFGLEANFFEQLLRAYTSLYNYRLLARAGRYWKQRRRDVQRLGLAANPDCGWLIEAIRQRRPVVRRRFWTVLRQRLRFDGWFICRSAIRPLRGARSSLQTLVGSTFAGARTTLHYEPALDAATLESLRRLLEPGDLLLVRAERKLTTALLPGFWAHAAIYLGSKKNLEQLGIARHPQVREHLESMADVRTPFGYVVDAVSPRVQVRPLEQCLHADHVLVLRPQVSDKDREGALIEAFGHVGKRYDFEFDFNVTTRVVCTELIYRSYHGRGPLVFDLVKRLGRYTLSCDDLVEQFLAAVAKGEPPFQLIALVLAGRNGKAYSVPSSEALDVLRSIQKGFRPSEAAPLAFSAVGSSQPGKELP
jgi:1-acyl-sn-glycerol-3-phosphate acyltransferase